MDNNSTALLLIGYKRVASLETILKIAIDSGIRFIYLSIDGSNEILFTSEQQQIQDIALGFQKNFQVSIKTFLRKSQAGCSANVFTSCDWIFRHEKKVIVLEDDCIPSMDFFSFVSGQWEFLECDDSILMICGTQFAPISLLAGRNIKSVYALTWGWATTSAKWLQIRQIIFRNLDDRMKYQNGSDLIEKMYWKSGSRRARFGYTDVWDTLLVAGMRSESKYAILPGVNLVTNIGNDLFATHTHGSSIGIGLPVFKFTQYGDKPIIDENIDEWLKRHVYQIDIFKFFRNMARKLLDSFRKPKYGETKLRFEKYSIPEELF